MILTQIETRTEVMQTLQQLHDSVLKSKEVQLAMAVVRCYQNKDFVGYFRTLKKSPYLFACAMVFSLTLMRETALQQMRGVRFLSLTLCRP